MTSHMLDRYIEGTSPLHRLDARVKLALAVGYIVCASLLPPGAWLALFGLTAMGWWAIALADVGWTTIFRRTLLGAPFVLVVVTIIFSAPGRPAFTIPLGFATLTATDEGLVRFATIIWKSWLSLQIALLLTATTHFLDVLRALQAWRLPPIMVALLSFTYRYLFILVDEAQRLLRARECRSASLEGAGGGSLTWRAKVTGQMVGTLFLRAFERSERVYAAMVSRGFDGDFHSLEPARLRPHDLWLGISAVGVYGILLFQAYWG